MPKQTTQALLKRIKPNAITPTDDAPPTVAQVPIDPEEAASSPFTGKPVAFWLDEDARTLLKKTRVLFVTQDIIPSDSLVVRTALQLLPEDSTLVIEKARELMARDGRKVRHQKRKPK